MWQLTNTNFSVAQDLDALTKQLSTAQSEAAAASARVAELESQLKVSEREVRALTKARDTMEVDLKAVLGRHAREVRSRTAELPARHRAPVRTRTPCAQSFVSFPHL
jgi:septal ring factor EnvC (AmiA/AmiB activator)